MFVCILRVYVLGVYTCVCVRVYVCALTALTVANTQCKTLTGGNFDADFDE